MRQIFFDTETTGLSPENGDRIVEVGCVEMVNRQLTGRNKHFYINPERRNHEDAVRIHGLTDEFLADKPLFAAVVDELVEFLGGAEMVIHNAAFDVGFMDAEFTRLGRPAFASIVSKVTDTLSLAREMYPGKSNSLDALCRRFGGGPVGLATLATVTAAKAETERLAHTLLHLCRRALELQRVEEVGIEAVECFGLHRQVGLAPPHRILAGGIADDEAVLRGAAGMLAGLHDQRTVLGEQALTPRHGLLHQRCGRQVPVDRCPGNDSLGFQPVRGDALAHVRLLPEI